MTCITGFVGAVPTANRDAFIHHARISADCFRDHGLSGVVECWGDDVPDGKTTSFPKAVQARPDEAVIFSWYSWPSRSAQDEGMRRAMEDPRLDPRENPMPFDGQRVIHGVFEPVLEIGASQPGGYFDCFVIPVPRSAREDFRTFAGVYDPIFAEHGAIWIVEAWELDVPDGKVTDFRRAVAAKPDEAIVFAWVQWPDRAARDSGNSLIMNDPRFSGDDCPFDMERIIQGGFAPVVQS